MRAVLKWRYEGKQRAEALLRAVRPDNLKTPAGIRITSAAVNKQIKITIDCGKGLGTLIATIDDLLSCISAAERTLDVLE